MGFRSISVNQEDLVFGLVLLDAIVELYERLRFLVLLENYTEVPQGSRVCLVF